MNEVKSKCVDHIAAFSSRRWIGSTTSAVLCDVSMDRVTMRPGFPGHVLFYGPVRASGRLSTNMAFVRVFPRDPSVPDRSIHSYLNFCVIYYNTLVTLPLS